jgi:hypothetical protein
MANRASLILAFGILIVAAAGVFVATDWPWKAKLFPLVIGIPLFFLALAELLWSLLSKTPPEEAPVHEAAARRTLLACAWIFGFLAAIVLLGFPVAVPLFVFAYLKLQGKEGWIFSLVFTAIVWALFYGLFDQLLHLPFPAGWLLDWVGLG